MVSLCVKNPNYAFNLIIVKPLLIITNFETKIKENNMTFEIIKRNFDRGLWNEQQVRKAFEKGIITQEQLNKILNK